MTRFRLVALAALALLAACDKDSVPQEGKLQGEVLDGTISDAMVPLDQVRSRAPLAEPGSSGSAAGEGSSSAGTRGDAAADVDAAQPTPAPAPAPAPAPTSDGPTD